MKNDILFLIMHVMNLWEHQSSFNPNMPVRFFLNAGQLYDKYMNDKVLNDYAVLIDGIRANQKAGMNIDDAVDTAIEATHDDSLLKKFLLGHRAEVKGMYLTEYDEEKERIRTLREGRNEGREEGRAEGRAEGRNEGRNEERSRLVSEMLKKNLPLTLIEEISQLSKDAICAIAKNIGVAVRTD